MATIKQAKSGSKTGSAMGRYKIAKKASGSSAKGVRVKSHKK